MEKRCIRCNMPVEPGFKFCKHCGTPVENVQPQYNGAQGGAFGGQSQGYSNQYTNGGYGYQQPQAPVQNTYQPAGYGYQTAPVQPNPYAAPGYSGQPLSKKEFSKNYATPKNRNGVKTAIVIGYVCAILSAVVNIGVTMALGEGFTGGGLLYLMLYVGVVLGGTVGLQATYNKGYAIGVLVMAVFDCILTLILYQRFGGWLVIVAALSAIKALGEIDKEYKQYLNSIQPTYRY